MKIIIFQNLIIFFTLGFRAFSRKMTAVNVLIDYCSNNCIYNKFRFTRENIKQKTNSIKKKLPNVMYSHIVSPISYLIKCYSQPNIFPIMGNIKATVNAPPTTWIMKIFKSFSSKFNSIFNKSLVTVLFINLFKVKTCVLANLGSTPPFIRSSYISRVVTCSIVNHLIKSVSNTISKLFQNVNTFLNFQEGIYTWQ